MFLTVDSQPDVLTPFAFTFVVPGHQQWKLRAVRASVVRVVGGAPARGYVLTVTDGTNIVAQFGAGDTGTEPGAADVTWCDAPASLTAAGAFGVIVAPMSAPALDAGYTITGTILNPAFGDGWGDAVAWYDYINIP